MHNGEWSLISFTLLSQLSVGLVLALGFIFFMHHAVFENLSGGFSFKAPEFIVLILILIATLLSFLHLGSPQHAYHSLNNLKGSWISREILMLSVFGFMVLLFMMSRMLNWQTVVIQGLLIGSMLIGLFLILAMSGIYLIPTVPSWNHFNTPLSFLGSALILGTVAMVLCLLYSSPDQLKPEMLKQLLLFILVAISIVFVSATLHFYQISRFEFTGIEQLMFKKGWFLTMFLIRSVMIVLIMMGLIYLMMNVSKAGVAPNKIKLMFITLFMLLLVEEVLGRYQFYASYFRIGV